MKSYQITCIETNIGNKDHEGSNDPITHVGGPWGPNGELIVKTVAEVLDLMKNGDQFYTVDISGKRTDVAPVHLKADNHIRTEADNSLENNLRSLPRVAQHRFDLQILGKST
ncbi:DUF3892 domain-containing protein [Sorangium sp. So ce128]|uniref:DUF3892 domain-containing protein n=1 Tax=Sorangium sp. So ce128 TaxID=3133281 RepID=UPI003F61BB82